MKQFCVLSATIIIFAFTIESHSHGQGVSVDFYQSQIHSKNETEVLLMKNYVKGALDGIQWANISIIKDKRDPLYCQPQSLGLNTNNAIQIIDYMIKSMPAKGDINISLLLFLGLQKSFPCKK